MKHKRGLRWVPAFLLCLVVVIVFGGGLYIIEGPLPPPTSAPAHTPVIVIASTTSVAKSRVPADLATTSVQATRYPATISRSIVQTPDITLIVASSSYQIDVPPDSTVLDVLRAAASTSALQFSGREYPSLGFFIDSINGVRGANGSYWALYINGTYSQLGASSAVVKAGDTVEWRYEKD